MKQCVVKFILIFKDISFHQEFYFSSKKSFLVCCRVQPFQALLALKTYELGKVEKGKLKWVPNSSILEALTSTFHSSFKVTDENHLIMCILRDFKYFVKNTSKCKQLTLSPVHRLLNVYLNLHQS